MAIGAYAIERDYSHYVAYASKTILAVVGTATKGPIGEAVAITSSQDLVNKFGALDPDHPALYTGQYFLTQSSKMYFVRVASSTAKSADTGITGVDTNPTDVQDAIKFEMLEKGTFSNGFTLTVIYDTTADTYSLILKGKNSITVEKIDDLKLTDLIVGYETSYMKITTVDPTIVSLTPGSYTFAGGNDGASDITSAEYIEGAKVLDTETLDINLIAVPGIADISVVTAVLAIAEHRGDCLYVIDPPKGLTVEGVKQWADGGGSYMHSKINSSYGAVYYDWVQIYDSINKQYVVVPPSVPVCATMAYSSRISDLWYAPAGLTRGLVQGVIRTETPLTKNEIELLQESNINAIYDDSQVGLVLWGQMTLYRETTALNRVNVRRLMNYMKKIVVAACNYLVFEPNDRVTWNSFEMRIKPTMESIKTRRGLYDYKIVRGEAIVTADDIDNYRMPCMVMVKPTKAAEEIPVYFVITSTGADFNEVLEANGVITL